jgi:hypothetical protein
MQTLPNRVKVWTPFPAREEKNFGSMAAGMKKQKISAPNP